ncbi:MAG: hypothetical protein VR66_03250 [Peptococcaceae bacterium BRH_c23]|nr:MAG: hypothetical protein VR66_03250 [Peptococcaceae bacterium BRH_c23]
MKETFKEVPSIWTTGWTDILNTGTWRSAIPFYQKRLAPCHCACPVDGEIPTWIMLARKQHYREAWSSLVDNNPFPAVTGRICHHPCEGACNRREYDGAVAVNALEQFVGDLALSEGWALPQPTVALDQKIAVIGGGPAGLSCAYQLKRLGYKVTIFETRPELGGVLRYGIPSYRLAKETWDGELRRLEALGIEVKLNHSVKASDLSGLEKEYSAVFLALGAQSSKTLPQFSVDNLRVFNGLDFLEKVNRGEAPPLGQDVVVIGGGSVALDVAGTARRLGSQVKVLALEARESLPAQPDELTESLEEGVEILAGVMVQNVGISFETLSLHCIRVTLDENSPAGVLRPIPLSGTEFSVSATNVILAVGQDAELTGWDSVINVGQSLVRVDANLATNRPGIFAGGDVTPAERFVSTAIGQGKKAAQSIDKYLKKPYSKGISSKDTQTSQDVVAYQEINMFYFPEQNREEKGTVAVEERLKNFAELKIGFSPQQTQTQSERCFSCGNCVECDNCFYFCPDMAVVKDSSLTEHYRILDQFCKGCGSCVQECPRGAVVLKEETGR